jgi:hypothetical protein
VFNDVLKGAPLAGEKDTAFLEEVKTKVAKMDRGIRVGSWGQLQGSYSSRAFFAFAQAFHDRVEA